MNAPPGTDEVPLGTAPRTSQTTDLALFLTLCLSIGSLYPATKLALQGFDPLTLVLCRLAIGALFLGGWALARGSVLPRSRHTLVWLSVAGVTNAGCSFLLVTWGQQHVTASFAAILGGMGPIFTAIGATFVLADERLTPRRAVGVVIGFTGVVVLLERQVGWHHVMDGSSQALGTGAILLGGIGLAAVAILVRTHMQGLSPVQIALPMVFAGLPFIALVTAVLGLTHLARLHADPSRAKATAAMFVLGFVNAGFGPLLYYGLILSWGATRTALIGYAVPVVGVALSLLLLHDHLTVEMVVGLALVMASFLWVNPLTRPASGLQP